MLSIVQAAAQFIDRRRAKRLHWNVAAVVVVPQADSMRRPLLFPATILDVSPYGLRIAHSQSIDGATRLTVLTPDFRFCGRIAWSRAAHDRYETGISVLPKPVRRICNLEP